MAFTSTACGLQFEDTLVDSGANPGRNATMCHTGSTKALVLMAGCATCLNCGYFKCG